MCLASQKTAGHRQPRSLGGITINKALSFGPFQKGLNPKTGANSFQPFAEAIGAGGFNAK